MEKGSGIGHTGLEEQGSFALRRRDPNVEWEKTLKLDEAPSRIHRKVEFHRSLTFTVLAFEPGAFR